MLQWCVRGRWAWLSLVLGCNGKLHVDPPRPVDDWEVFPGALGGSSGFGHQGGSGGNVETPGSLRAACIPAATASEATGSLAEAMVSTLQHCDAGVSCDDDGRCSPAPDCPQSRGTCVVHRGDAAAAATNTGGSGGSETNVTIVGTAAGVRAMAASDSDLYWLEYGTRDALGNYRNDGGLMALSLSDDMTRVVASGLEGPVRLGLTDSYAYISFDGGPLVGAPTQPRLSRIPLGGGAVEDVQSGTLLEYFTSVGDQPFWMALTHTDSMNPVYTVAATDTQPSVFLKREYLSEPRVDASGLFCTEFVENAGTQLLRAALDGGTVQNLGASQGVEALHDDYIYDLETIGNGAGTLLVRMPKTGGASVRVQALGAGGNGRSIQIVGEHFFFDSEPPLVRDGFTMPDDRRINVLRASLDASAPPVRLLSRSSRHSYVDQLWVGTANALYWSDGASIYRRSLDAE